MMKFSETVSPPVSAKDNQVSGSVSSTLGHLETWHPRLEIMIIDSHQHFWQVGHFDYPWMTAEVGVLCQEYLPSQLESILKACDIAKTVLVQASNSLADHWLLSLAERYPFIPDVVGWVDLRDPPGRLS